MLNQKHDKVTEENFNALNSTVSDHTSTLSDHTTNISNNTTEITNIKNNYIPRANYAEITIETTDVDSTTLTCLKTLTGATVASHPLVGCLTTDPNTKDDELEAFGTILYAETGVNNITFTFSEVPSADFTVQVVDF